MAPDHLGSDLRPALLELEAFGDARGSLVALDSADVPFPIRRVFFITDVPHDAARGGHGHLECAELIVAASGAFTVITDDRDAKQTFRLDRPTMGLHLPPGACCELRDFTTGAVCLVLASHDYDPGDHVPRNVDST